MTYKNITQQAEAMVAYHTIKSGFDSIAKRAERRLKPLALNVYDGLVAGRQISEDSIVFADYRFDPKKVKARTMSEAVKEFKQQHPKYGSILQKMINETRQTKKRYIEFGLVGGPLANEVYQDALLEIGVNSEHLDETLSTALDISDTLAEKREEGLTRMLVK